MENGRSALVGIFLVVLSMGAVACGDDDESNKTAPTSNASGEQTSATAARDALDKDPDEGANPEDIVVMNTPLEPSTESEIIKRFAPHFHLHPEDKNMPANVDWYLQRVTMRFNHDNCPDHELLGLGKVNQQSLIAQTHEDNKSFCRHDDSKKVNSTNSDHFFLEIADHATYLGAPRTEWKTYVNRRPRKDDLIDLEYWAFYPFNDAFSSFNHESDWEHLRLTIDPKADNGKGELREVRFSQHNHGETLKVGDARLVIEDGTHPVSHVAKGTHANYPQPGSFPIEETKGVINDTAAKAAPQDVWKSETTIVEIGTRAAPKNGQVFVKYWGRWGEIGELSFTSGVTRHFP